MSKTRELLSEKITQNFACLLSHCAYLDTPSVLNSINYLFPKSLSTVTIPHPHHLLPEGLQLLLNLSPCHQLCGQLPFTFSQLQFLSQVC